MSYSRRKFLKGGAAMTLGAAGPERVLGSDGPRVVAIDCGMKRSIGERLAGVERPSDLELDGTDVKGLLLEGRKLPARTFRQEYTLEYGTDAVEIHQDALKPGCRVLLIDDLIATGGTAAAALDLLRRALARGGLENRAAVAGVSHRRPS